MFDVNYLQVSLENYVCEITFTKVDGSERVMKCTLLPSYLPEEYRNRGTFLSERGENALSVWDIDSNSWKSFRINSVSSIKLLPKNLNELSNLLL